MLEYYNMGFHLPGGANLAYHVTPFRLDILRDGLIYPRYKQAVPNEVLGGVHQFSISAYNNREDAMNTLYYLYGIYCIAHGIWDKNYILRKLQDIGRDRNAFKYIFESNYSPAEKLAQICIATQCDNPIVYNDSFTNYTNPQNLTVFVFPIPSSIVFSGYSARYGDSNLPFDNYPTFRIIEEEYSLKHSGMYDPNSSSFFYDMISDRIKSKKKTVDPSLDYKNALNKKKTERAAWYLAPEEYSSSKEIIEELLDKTFNKGAIATEDMLIDLNPIAFPIDDCVVYRYQERELQIFRDVPTEAFVEEITLDDVFEEIERRTYSDAMPLTFPKKRIIAPVTFED